MWLTELARRLGRRATLDDVAGAELDRLAETGFDWIRLLNVWFWIDDEDPPSKARFSFLFARIRNSTANGMHGDAAGANTARRHPAPTN